MSVPMGIMMGYVLASVIISASHDSVECSGILCWRWPFLVQVMLLIPLTLWINLWVPSEHMNIRIIHHHPQENNKNSSSTTIAICSNSQAIRSSVTPSADGHRKRSGSVPSSAKAAHGKDKHSSSANDIDVTKAVHSGAEIELTMKNTPKENRSPSKPLAADVNQSGESGDRLELNLSHLDQKNRDKSGPSIISGAPEDSPPISEASIKTDNSSSVATTNTSLVDVQRMLDKEQVNVSADMAKQPAASPVRSVGVMSVPSEAGVKSHTPSGLIVDATGSPTQGPPSTISSQDNLFEAVESGTVDNLGRESAVKVGYETPKISQPEKESVDAEDLEEESDYQRYYDQAQTEDSESPDHFWVRL
jgi:hypothetical protein